MDENKEPKYILHGVNEDLIVSENEVVLQSQGILGWLVHGQFSSKVIPISTIQSVFIKKATIWDNGALRFYVEGEPGKEIKNSISITIEQNRLAEEIKSYIESLLKCR